MSVPKRGEKVRCSNTWTEARYWQFIRSALRSAFMRYPPKWECLENSKRNKPKDVVGRHKFEYKCSKCEQYFTQKKVEVDHILPCGSLKSLGDASGFIGRMFCEVDGFRVLCKPCHAEITAAARKEKKK